MSEIVWSMDSKRCCRCGALLDYFEPVMCTACLEEALIEMKRFEESMKKIQAIAGHSQEQLDEIKQGILNMASDEKKVYICNDCKRAWDAEKYGKWVETYMSNLMVWVCWDCLKEDQSLRK